MWDVGQPNSFRGLEEDCVGMRGITVASYDNIDKWHDYPCSVEQTFVCATKRVLVL
jgi:hypothetical protein